MLDSTQKLFQLLQGKVVNKLLSESNQREPNQHTAGSGDLIETDWGLVSRIFCGLLA